MFSEIIFIEIFIEEFLLKINFKMKESIEIPDGVNAEIAGSVVKIEGKFGKLERKFDADKVKIEKNQNKIILETAGEKKSDKAILYTFKSHIKNMVHGVKDKITYEMKVVFSHFPVTCEVKGDSFIIKNFLGEKLNRSAKILSGVKVTVSGKDIKLEGVDIEKVSQTAANIEQAAKIIEKDRRVFQDGIYITKKDGVLIK